MKWEITFCQQMGSNHKQNQDALFNGKDVYQYRLKKAETFYLESEKVIVGIADGVSNSPKPQLASRFLMEKLSDCRELNSRWLRQIQFELSETLAKNYLGSSATFVGAECDKFGNVKIINVGDSKAYKITQQGEWVKLSIEHTILSDIAQQNESNDPENYAQIYRGLSDCITADYTSDDFRIFSQVYQLEKGDSLLLCSDGFIDDLSEDLRKKIWENYSNNKDRLTISRKIVKKMKEYDDFSVIICKQVEK